MRSTLLLAFALVLGFVLGWVMKPATKPNLPGVEPPLVQNPAQAKPTPPADTAPVLVAPFADRNEKHQSRAEIVRWLRRSGASINFRALEGDALSPELKELMELTSAEIAHLNDVVIGTKRELDAARLLRTTSHTSEDGKTLTVNVPAVDVPTSRAAYDRLLETFKSILGAGRYEVFNELGGDGFERAFGQFGLSNVRYELSLQPVIPLGHPTPVYEYKRYFLDATGTTKGWGGSTVSIDQIEKYDPILAKILQGKLAVDEAK